MKGRAWLYPVLGAVMLAALFLLLRPAPPERAVPPEPVVPRAAALPMASGPAAREPPLATHSVELVVRAGALASGPATIRVREGEAVTIRVIADVREELHLHGYDLALALEPGTPATLMFVADRSGRFEYELERSHTPLGVLEVMPR